jgi:HAD superfamily hydrolase (TIGR01509 family)
MRQPALLFDLDGTLCETDDLHYEAFAEMLQPFDRPLSRDEYNDRIMGFGNADIFGYLFPGMPVAEYRDLVAEKERVFRRLLDALPPLPGLTDLLDRADAKGVPYCVVTNAPRDSGSVQLEKLGLAARMGEPVYGQELARPKPDPLPYATGLERLAGDPARSLAFEDSRSGIRSAVGAGLVVIGLCTTLPEEALVAAGARIGIRDYTDPRLADLIGRIGGW